MTSQVRGVIVDGVEVPAHLRGVIRGGVEASGTVRTPGTGGTDPNPGGGDVTFVMPTSITEVSGFLAGGSNYGWYYPTGVVGAGIGTTGYRVTANTSSATPPHPGVNPINVMCVGSMSAGSQPTGIEVGNLTLLGSAQSHLFGGLRVASSNGAYIHDVQVKGMPGDAAGPAGGNETFALGAWRADNMHLKNVLLDGLDAGGKAVMATGVGMNFMTGVLIENITIHDAVYGMGITWWQCGSAEIRGADLRGNRKPINMERNSNGRIDIYDMDVTGYTNSVPITVNSDLGSTALTLYDPIWEKSKGPLKIGWAQNAYSGGQLQKTSDIHVIIGGVDVTADPTKVYIGGY